MERFWLLVIGIAAAIIAVLLFHFHSAPVIQPAVVQRYLVMVDLDPQTRTLEVEARVQLKMAGQRSKLYLFRLGGSLELLEARVEGANGQIQTEKEEKWYVFNLIGHSKSVLAVLRYRIKSSPDIEGIAFHLGSEEGYVLGEATWIPRVDKRLDTYPPTPYQLTIRLPEPLIAVSAGVSLNESHTNGQASFTWEMPFAMGSPFFAYGLYDIVREQNATAYILRSLGPEGVQGGRKLLEAMQEILSYYAELFGPPPELPVKIVAVTRRGGWGGPLTPLLNGATFTNTKDGLDQKILFFLAHELAHTWWGGLIGRVDLKGSGWLFEGLANYAAALALGHRYGAAMEQHVFQHYQKEYLTLTKDIPLAQQTYSDAVYSNSSYNKGAWVHRMLEGLIGRERYLNALKEFVQTYRGKAISPKEYQQAMERAYGQSLAWFFQQWVHQVVSPVYRVEMQPGAVRIVNEGSGEMPLTVRLQYEDGTNEDVQVRVRGATTIPVQRPLARVILDPNGYVLQGLQKDMQQGAVDAIDDAVKSELIRVADLLEKAIQTGDFAPVEAALVADGEAQGKCLSLLKRLSESEISKSFRTELQEIGYDPQTQKYILKLQGTIVAEGKQLKGPVQWEFKKTEEGWSLVNCRIKI